MKDKNQPKEEATSTSKSVYVIPLDTPVRGRDVKKLVDSLGVSYDESHWLFGVCVGTWTSMVTHGLNAIVTNPTLALLAKYYSHHPEKVPIPKKRTFADLLRACEGARIQDIGTYVGKEKVTAHRWNNSGTGSKPSPFSPAVQRLVNHLYDEAMQGNIRWWEKMVEGEAKARGTNDIWVSANWNNKYIKQQHQRAELTQKLARSISNLESDCNSQQLYLDQLGLDIEESDINRIVNENYVEIHKAAKQAIKTAKLPSISVQEKVKLFKELLDEYLEEE